LAEIRDESSEAGHKSDQSEGPHSGNASSRLQIAQVETALDANQ
jgi:hypothetical protein